MDWQETPDRYPQNGQSSRRLAISLGRPGGELQKEVGGFWKGMAGTADAGDGGQFDGSDTESEQKGRWCAERLMTAHSTPDGASEERIRNPEPYTPPESPSKKGAAGETRMVVAAPAILLPATPKVCHFICHEMNSRLMVVDDSSIVSPGYHFHRIQGMIS